jgi:hypothetical protein
MHSTIRYDSIEKSEKNECAFSRDNEIPFASQPFLFFQFAYIISESLGLSVEFSPK